MPPKNHKILTAQRQVRLGPLTAVDRQQSIAIVLLSHVFRTATHESDRCHESNRCLFDNDDLFNFVSTFDCIDHIKAFNHFTEASVLAIEMGCIVATVANKEL